MIASRAIFRGIRKNWIYIPVFKLMKKLKTILALCAFTIPVLSAQTAAPVKPKEAPADQKVAEIKAETPVEERAFKMFETMSGLSDIFGSIKDEASLAEAKTKLDALIANIEAQAEELKKLEAPDNEARIKLSGKMELKAAAMNEKMSGVFQKMAELPEDLQSQFSLLMRGFGTKIDTLSPTMDKYFEPDEEEEEEKKGDE